VGLGQNAAMKITLWCLVTAAALLARTVLLSAEPRDKPSLPLKVGKTGRYLVDQQKKPVLIAGDTAWSIIAQLDQADVERYLADREEKGFNSIIVNLIEHKFATRAPATRSGIPPFKSAGDFSTPNPEYFEWARRVVLKANDHGIIVWLAPAYLGYGGGDEGFFREMKAGGPEKLRSYGRFLGAQFKDVPNIIWLLGGDYTPQKDDRWTVTALAEAIREKDSLHLMTVHASPETAAAAAFGQEPWLGVDTVYSYDAQLFRPILAERTRSPARPFVMIESTYEGEHDSKPQQIRRQAYWAMLGGACGHFLGNNPIWHFDGPGLFPVKQSWQEALSGTGSHDVARMNNLLRELPWWQLRPEQDHAVITEGYGTGAATALTAITPDKKLSLTYVPPEPGKSRTLMVNGAHFNGPIQAQWFNPRSGEFTEAPESPWPNEANHPANPPATVGAGEENDWILLLRAR
jgi:hypothetical protein